MNETVDLETRLTEFEAYLKGLDRSRHSVRAYLSDLRLFAQWFEGHMGEKFAATNLIDDDVKNWRDEMENKQKASTINRKLAALSAFYAWAVEKKYVASDPTRHIHGLGQQIIAPKALSEQAVNKIIRKAKVAGNLRDHALLHFLAATGLRASEVAAVKCGDIQINDRSGWVTVRSGKGRVICVHILLILAQPITELPLIFKGMKGFGLQELADRFATGCFFLLNIFTFP